MYPHYKDERTPCVYFRSSRIFYFPTINFVPLIISTHPSTPPRFLGFVFQKDPQSSLYIYRCVCVYIHKLLYIHISLEEFFLHCLTLESGAKRLSRNVSTKLPFYAAQNPKRVQISFTPRSSPEITRT